YWGAGITILFLVAIIFLLIKVIRSFNLLEVEADKESIQVENENISGFFSESKEKTVEKEERKKKEENQEKQQEDDDASKNLALATDECVLEIENIDVQAEVENIRKLYYETQENLVNYSQYEYDDVIYYWDTAGPVKVIVKEGKKGTFYTRNYYYVNNKIYFAFVFHGTEEHRFYFKDDMLIRYINPDKEIYDYGNVDMHLFDEWTKEILEESSSVLE
ncbi:MAG: hypothetical protein ACI4ED_06555, partial [Suilimivivens sp.]